jgi:flavin reductase (DIM6/NTAB) family NADH-FMN oxidoreductase RutF
MTLNPKDLEPRHFYSYMTAAVAPRPIAFASTVDLEGNVNLSPFSFFNLMGINPPILVFSPNNRGKDGSKKDTILNLYQVPEVVINMVDYQMVQQMSLSSCEYPKGVNEFIKAGFNEEKSILITPPRVKESAAQFECNVLEIKELGSANIVICEVIMAHFSENILDKNQKIDQLKTDWVARLGTDFYARANAPALFEVPKPNLKLGIGIDQLPPKIKNSRILSGNDLGMLANIETMPDKTEIEAFRSNSKIKDFYNQAANGCVLLDDLLQAEAKTLLTQNDIHTAWLTLLS